MGLGSEYPSLWDYASQLGPSPPAIPADTLQELRPSTSLTHRESHIDSGEGLPLYIM